MLTKVFLRLLTAFFAIGPALCVPLQSRSSHPKSLTNADLINFALGIEYIQEAFYAKGLSLFDDNAFSSAGFAPTVRKRFEEIYEHEQFHVDALKQYLGKDAIKPCKYNFPFTDVQSFTIFAQGLEETVVSAYLGLGQYIKDKSLLAGSEFLLSIETRHATWVSNAVNGDTPWSGPIDTPLTLLEVYSLAAGVTSSCPASNGKVPFPPYPELEFTNPNAKPGDTVTLVYKGQQTKQKLFLSIANGLNSAFVPIVNGQATLPKNLVGTVYAAVTRSDKLITDETLVTGPLVLLFPDPQTA